jgi:hypothetical protein
MRVSFKQTKTKSRNDSTASMMITTECTKSDSKGGGDKSIVPERNKSIVSKRNKSIISGKIIIEKNVEHVNGNGSTKKGRSTSSKYVNDGNDTTKRGRSTASERANDSSDTNYTSRKNSTANERVNDSSDTNYTSRNDGTTGNLQVITVTVIICEYGRRKYHKVHLVDFVILGAFGALKRKESLQGFNKKKKTGGSGKGR